MAGESDGGGNLAGPAPQELFSSKPGQQNAAPLSSRAPFSPSGLPDFPTASPQSARALGCPDLIEVRSSNSGAEMPDPVGVVLSTGEVPSTEWTSYAAIWDEREGICKSAPLAVPLADPWLAYLSGVQGALPPAIGVSPVVSQGVRSVLHWGQAPWSGSMTSAPVSCPPWPLGYWGPFGIMPTQSPLIPGGEPLPSSYGSIALLLGGHGSKSTGNKREKLARGIHGHI